MGDIRCETCRYFDLNEFSVPSTYDTDDDKAFGYCKRHAPRPRLLDCDEEPETPLFIAYWPKVDLDDWCGEYTHPHNPS